MGRMGCRVPIKNVISIDWTPPSNLFPQNTTRCASNITSPWRLPTIPRALVALHPPLPLPLTNRIRIPTFSTTLKGPPPTNTTAIQPPLANQTAAPHNPSPSNLLPQFLCAIVPPFQFSPYSLSLLPSSLPAPLINLNRLNPNPNPPHYLVSSFRY